MHGAICRNEEEIPNQANESDSVIRAENGAASGAPHCYRAAGAVKIISRPRPSEGSDAEGDFPLIDMDEKNTDDNIAPKAGLEESKSS